MKDYKLPSREECFKFLKEYRVPSHIVRHSLTAAKLAVFLGERLREKGTAIDVELVERACLLHDIARVCDFPVAAKRSEDGKELEWSKFEQEVTEEDKACWNQLRAKYKGLRHEEAACDILNNRYPVLAKTIKRHWYMGMLDEQTRLQTWEEKLVFYADMRVLDDRIVPLKDRLREGHKRNVHLHGTEEQSKIDTAKVDPLVYELEREIFAMVGLEPEGITETFIESFSQGRNDLGS